MEGHPSSITKFLDTHFYHFSFPPPYYILTNPTSLYLQLLPLFFFLIASHLLCCTFSYCAGLHISTPKTPHRQLAMYVSPHHRTALLCFASLPTIPKSRTENKYTITVHRNSTKTSPRPINSLFKFQQVSVQPPSTN